MPVFGTAQLVKVRWTMPLADPGHVHSRGGSGWLIDDSVPFGRASVRAIGPTALTLWSQAFFGNSNRIYKVEPDRYGNTFVSEGNVFALGYSSFSVSYHKIDRFGQKTTIGSAGMTTANASHPVTAVDYTGKFYRLALPAEVPLMIFAGDKLLQVSTTQLNRIVADAQGNIYTSSYAVPAGRLAKFSASGDLLWSKDLQGRVSLAPGAGVFLERYEGSQAVVHFFNGHGVLRNMLLGRNPTFGKSGRIYTIESNGLPSWLRAHSAIGEFLWARDLGDNYTAWIIAVDDWDNVYVQRRFHVIGVAYLGVDKIGPSGDLIWSTSIKNAAESGSPPAYNSTTGDMVFGSGSALYCLQQAPEAFDDTFTTGQGQAVTGSIATNDRYSKDAVYDLPGGNGTRGSLTLNKYGQFTFVPKSGWSGTVEYWCRSRKPGLQPGFSKLRIVVQ